jgi:intein/homing endonuclease
MVDFSKHDFTKMSDIKVGDNICISRNLIEYESNRLLPKIDCSNSKLELNLPKTMTNDLAWFFGILVGDGYYADNKKMDGRIEITFNQKEKHKIDKYLSICNSIGLNAKYQITGDNKSRAYCFSRYFMKFIRACGMNSYSCSSQKNVPNSILSSSSEHKSSFLRGLFDADASVRKSGIRLVSISKELMESCQLMLLEFGVVSKLSLQEKKRTYISKNKAKINAKYSYCLTLIGPNSNKKFMENIGFTDPSKTKYLVELCSSSRNISKTNLDIVPFSNRYRSEISSHLKKAFIDNSRKGGGKGVLGNGLNGLKDGVLKIMAYGKRKTFGFPEVKYYMDTCANRKIYPNDIVSELSKTSFFYDRVEKIEEVGRINMYDIEVEDLHSFSCQGFIAHNSQGSEFDYVIMPIMPQYSMMLYRNLVYTGLTRAKRLAVIIGSKESLVKAVNNTNYKVRQTSLKEMVLGLLPSW